MHASVCNFFFVFFWVFLPVLLFLLAEARESFALYETRHLALKRKINRQATTPRNINAFRPCNGWYSKKKKKSNNRDCKRSQIDARRCRCIEFLLSRLASSIGRGNARVNIVQNVASKICNFSWTDASSVRRLKRYSVRRFRNMCVVTQISIFSCRK